MLRHLAIFLLAAILVLAQSKGTIHGDVTDATGAPIPNATPVETSSGDVSHLVTGMQLQNYALPGRNPYYMLGILPGIVSRYGNFTTDFRATSYSMGALMIDGGRKDTNFVTLDGINNG